MQVEFQLPHDLVRSPSPRPDATAQVGANAVKASQDILNTQPHVSPNWQWGTGLSTRQQGENITHDDADDYYDDDDSPNEESSLDVHNHTVGVLATLPTIGTGPVTSSTVDPGHNNCTTFMNSILPRMWMPTLRHHNQRTPPIKTPEPPKNRIWVARSTIYQI